MVKANSDAELPKGATVEAVPRTTGMSNRLLPTISPTGISFFQRIPAMAEVAMRSKRNHPYIHPTTPSMVVRHTDTDAPILPGGQPIRTGVEKPEAVERWLPIQGPTG
jgi:hypothetical protein